MELCNLLGLDYREEATKFQQLDYGIIDFHSHLHGKEAAIVYKEVAKLYGIQTVYTMSGFHEIDELRSVLGDMVHFIAFPNFFSSNPEHDHGEGYLNLIRDYHSEGAKVVKFWAAPRGVDFAENAGIPGALSLDTPVRRKGMELACELDMAIMVHVADPDTWFERKYVDVKRYGTKTSQYEPLEELIQSYPTKWIAAHMGGWPEDLDFLSGLLERNQNLHLDSSATKWIVREISKHPVEKVHQFMDRWRGRILFGSDIVTSDDHLTTGEGSSFKADQASSVDEAFQIYASRYWALRTLWETDYEGPSPIADPDLQMVDPEKYNDSSSPLLRGMKLPEDVLKQLYCNSAANLL